MKPKIDISQLSLAECILLAEQLWERARKHPEAVAVTEAQLTELNRRLDAHEHGELVPGCAVGRSRCLARNSVTLRVVIESPARDKSRLLPGG